MKITILNGNPDEIKTGFESYSEELVSNLENALHDVQTFTLRDMNIKYCVGCFGCWIKTPGECFHKDDMPEILRAAINSDLVLFTSPVIMGFASALLKKTMDRMIPVVHPYIVMDHGECHHLKRYKNYPLLGLILEDNDQTDQEDLEIIHNSYKRLSRNFKSELRFLKLTREPVMEVINEINRL